MSWSSFSNVCSWPRSWWYVVIPINADSKSRAQVWKRKSLRWHGIAVCFEASSSSFPAIRVTACSTALASVQGSMRSLLTGPQVLQRPVYVESLASFPPSTASCNCLRRLLRSLANLERTIGVIVKITGWNQNQRTMIFWWFSTHPLFRLKKWATV